MTAQEFKGYVRKHILEAVGTIVITAITTASILSWNFTEENSKQNEALEYVIPVVDSLNKNKQDYTELNNKVDTLTLIVRENTELTKELQEKIEEDDIEDDKERTRLWTFLEKLLNK